MVFGHKIVIFISNLHWHASQKCQRWDRKIFCIVKIIFLYKNGTLVAHKSVNGCVNINVTNLNMYQITQSPSIKYSCINKAITPNNFIT